MDREKTSKLGQRLVIDAGFSSENAVGELINVYKEVISQNIKGGVTDPNRKVIAFDARYVRCA